MSPFFYFDETSCRTVRIADPDASPPAPPPDRFPRVKQSRRRRFHWSRPKTYARHRLASSTDPDDAALIRPHHRTLYVAHVAQHRVPREPENVWWNAHHLPRKVRSQFERHLGEEDVELARCTDFRLPGQPRVPSLERQDAFCEGRRGVGLKKQGQVQCERTRGRKRPVEADDEELYRMGLLYDDEHERGEGFGMDMIERGPVEVRVVPARGRRGGKGRKVTLDRTATAVGQDDDDDKDAEWEEERWKLDLALSFAQLGDDEALAAYLMAPGAEERVVGGAGRVTRRHEGLTVVYELEEDSCWTQRPELDDEWAFLDTKERDDSDKSATATNPDTDAWIVLGSDGL